MNETATEATPIAARPDVTGRRIVAALIDIVLFILVFVAMAFIIGDGEASSGEDGSSINVSLNGFPAIVFFLIWFGYFTFLEMMTGQTLGKKVMGIKVVTVSGVPLGLGKSAIRTVCRFVDGIPFFLPYLLGLIVMVTNKEKQRIGDMAAGTIVVKV